MVALGKNVFGKIEGTTLTMEVDLAGDLGPSASGKSRKVATTSGNVGIGIGLKLGVNLYEPID